MKCSYCKGTGHIHAECPRLLADIVHPGPQFNHLRRVIRDLINAGFHVVTAPNPDKETA